MNIQNTPATTASIKRWIHVEFVKEGIHCYPAAATDPKLATGEWDDVSFLANPHFHYFTFKVKVEVTFNDRDIEFIQFRRWCELLYSANGTMQVNSKSCEMLAEELISVIAARYPGREIHVSVLEDNINGATLEYKEVK
jgi:hypothetical protein